MSHCLVTIGLLSSDNLVAVGVLLVVVVVVVVGIVLYLTKDLRWPKQSKDAAA